MATTMVDAAATGFYPRLYPTLEDLQAHFRPIQPYEAEAEQEPRKQEEEQEEEGGMPVVNGEGEGDLREASDRQDDRACLDPSTEAVSPSQDSADTREVTVDAEEQTTNGDVAMNGSTEGQDNLTPQDKPQTGEAVDEGRLTQREEYVDRVWEEFVTHFLLGSRHIQKAAIFDLATRRPLAMNGNVRISTEELEQLVTSLQYHQLAYRNGVTLEGKTYKVRLADGRNGIWARTEREGCTVCRTHTLVIIGVHDEAGNSRKCNEDVMRLGDFFRKKAL